MNHAWQSDDGTRLTFERGYGYPHLRLAVRDGLLSVNIAGGTGPTFVDTSVTLTPDDAQVMRQWIADAVSEANGL
jgi:hypothetical protein